MSLGYVVLGLYGFDCTGLPQQAKSNDALTKVNKINDSMKSFDKSKPVQPLVDLVSDMKSLIKYSKSVQEKGISSYTPGRINTQPWFNDLNTRLGAMQMLNRSAISTDEELNSINN